MTDNDNIIFIKKRRIEPVTIRIDAEDRVRINYLCKEYNLSTREVVHKLLNAFEISE